MAELTIWSPEEVEKRSMSKRALQREERERLVEEYSKQFENVEPGFGGQVMLEEDDDKRKIRQIVRDAAAQHNLTLRFRPIKDKQRIEFNVIDPSTIPPRRGGRRGRPRKNPQQ